ncbi:MAG: cysteine peptidase family C39 domain-containing protein [bacterium]
MNNSGDFFKKVFKSKYPVVRQYDQIDCGPAALLSILKFWGGDSSLVHVRELTKTDAQGSNMLGLVNAAKELGFAATGATSEYEDLMKERMPCIAHVVREDNLQHFVVIYKIDSEKVLIGDPGKGRYKLPKDRFLEIWKQQAVILLTPKTELLNNTPPV